MRSKMFPISLSTRGVSDGIAADEEALPLNTAVLKQLTIVSFVCVDRHSAMYTGLYATQSRDYNALGVWRATESRSFIDKSMSACLLHLYIFSDNC
jgi:hypothetical protein